MISLCRPSSARTRISYWYAAHAQRWVRDDFGTYTQLERDRWIWALNAEKERCTRAHLAAGERLRNWGNLPRFRTLLHTNGTADSRPAFGERMSSSSDRSW